jgi:hypothetical protein
MATSFSVRTTIAISNSPAPLYFKVENNLVVVSGYQDASVFVVIQTSIQGVLSHTIRYGHNYIAKTTIGGIPRLTLSNQPYTWFLTTTNQFTVTGSTVDLLGPPQLFFIVDGSNEGVYITITGVSNLISTKQLNQVTQKSFFNIQFATQPEIEEVRNLFGISPLSPAESYASIYRATQNTTINGFRQGVSGQLLMVYAVPGVLITCLLYTSDAADDM